MTHAPEAVERNDAAPPDAVHDPDKVQPILSLADARLVAGLAQQALDGLPRVPIGHSRSAGRAAVARVRDALDEAWLAR